MKEFFRINLPILLIISFFLHGMFIFMWTLPDSAGVLQLIERKKRAEERQRGDYPETIHLIENINQDDRRIIDKNTMMSDRDSSAKGYVTKEKGNRWMKNQLELKLSSGSKSSGGSTSTGGRLKYSGADDAEALVTIMSGYSRAMGMGGGSSMAELSIPNKDDVTRLNALWYSRSTSFSFNTAKFNNYAFFSRMVNKIASNWYPPMMSNVRIGGYAPGSMTINAIPKQDVKLYFIIDRSGEVLEVKLLDSMGNTPLDSACLDAIRMAKNFGKVPDDIKGEYILIPFIFGFSPY